jgi:teichoic acid transport system permease protein
MLRLGVRPSLPQYARSLWARRDFIVALPLSQLSSRNADTLLGGFWHLLNPLVLAATYFLIFGIIFEVRRDVENFAAFLVIGIFVFHFTAKCLNGGAKTIVSNRGIIRSINLPRATFPIGSVLGETLAYLPALGMMLALILVTGEPPRLSWALLVPIASLQMVFNLGLTFWIGRLTFHFGDVRNLLPFIIRLWLYMSGVFFAASHVPDGFLRAAFELNPLHIFISLHRQALLDGGTSAASWVGAATWTLLSLGSGLIFFWSREESYGRE